MLVSCDLPPPQKKSQLGQKVLLLLTLPQLHFLSNIYKENTSSPQLFPNTPAQDFHNNDVTRSQSLDVKSRPCTTKTSRAFSKHTFMAQVEVTLIDSPWHQGHNLNPFPWPQPNPNQCISKIYAGQQPQTEEAIRRNRHHISQHWCRCAVNERRWDIAKLTLLFVVLCLSWFPWKT